MSLIANNAAPEANSVRSTHLFRQHQDEIYRGTDQLLSKLMLCQWIGCVVVALLMSAHTWAGETRSIHIHVWAALLLGGTISIFPVWLARVWPGHAITRHVFATAQMLMSALLIGLTGGRIETHFHVFASLVILSFYRDWRILIPATLVVALDHLIRGIYWPYSVYGVLTASPWRSLEHAGWVLFTDVFLVISCLRSVGEMRAIANRTAALEASENGFRQLFEQAPIGMAIVGVDNRFKQANATLCDMLGYRAEELTGTTPLDITHPEDRERSRNLADAMNGKSRSSIEKRYIRKTGEPVWTTRTACAIRDEAGNADHFLMMVEDISDRKHAEAALGESQRRLETALAANQLIMDNSQDVICTVNAEGRFITVSAASSALWGYTPAELVGREYIEFVHPDDKRQTSLFAEELMRGANQKDFVNRYVRKDGSLVDVLWSVSWSEREKTVFCVAHDVTQRARTEKELREAKEEADRANHAKSEFLSRMSHELRTPLNAILGFGQLLERQKPTEAQRTRIHYILSAGRHLLNLINEVLDISRIEAGNLQLSLEPVSVTEVLHETLELMRPLTADRSIALTVATQFDPEAHVLGDRQRFKQVLLNLLSNAVKYTPVGGAVTVSGSSSGEGLTRIDIADTGAGIPADKLSRLFTPFDRLGAEQSPVEGTGLGLALSQRLMHAMHGTVGVNSTPGKGSTFWIELPTVESPLRRLDAQKKQAHEDEHTAGAARRKILYIEDNVSNLTLVEQLLADQPEIQLLSAMQGQMGLDLATLHLPSLILLDLHLPDLPGWEVLERLQSNPATSHIPVVVISADATIRQVQKLIAAGARSYLTKPIDMTEFYRAIAETDEKPARAEPVCAAA
jgi:PAS domain S-box-containing protein